MPSIAAWPAGATRSRLASVMVKPGVMAFAVTPAGPSSLAIERVKPMIAAFEVT